MQAHFPNLDRLAQYGDDPDERERRGLPYANPRMPRSTRDHPVPLDIIYKEVSQ